MRHSHWAAVLFVCHAFPLLVFCASINTQDATAQSLAHGTEYILQQARIHSAARFSAAEAGAIPVTVIRASVNSLRRFRKVHEDLLQDLKLRDNSFVERFTDCEHEIEHRLPNRCNPRPPGSSRSGSGSLSKAPVLCSWWRYDLATMAVVKHARDEWRQPWKQGRCAIVLLGDDHCSTGQSDGEYSKAAVTVQRLAGSRFANMCLDQHSSEEDVNSSATTAASKSKTGRNTKPKTIGRLKQPKKPRDGVDMPAHGYSWDEYAQLFAGSCQQLLNLQLNQSSDPTNIDDLDANFVGQRHVIKELKEILRDRKSGWSRQDRPLTMVFMGPSGVGKTLLAKRLAAVLHDQPSTELKRKGKYHMFSMGNFQDEKSINNFLGPPVGIVGDSQLTGKLQQNPDSVVVLDEWDKAHPVAVPQAFLQVFDSNGAIRDSKTDTEVSTVKTTFILTSNVGAKEILAAASASSSPSVDVLVSTALSATESPRQDNRFRLAEFRGRIQHWLVFLPYTSEERVKVAHHMLASMAVFAKSHKGKTLIWTDLAAEHVASKYGGHSGQEGLRPMNVEAEKVLQVARRLEAEGKLLGAECILVYKDSSVDSLAGIPVACPNTALPVSKDAHSNPNSGPTSATHNVHKLQGVVESNPSPANNQGLVGKTASYSGETFTEGGEEEVEQQMEQDIEQSSMLNAFLSMHWSIQAAVATLIALIVSSAFMPAVASAAAAHVISAVSTSVSFAAGGVLATTAAPVAVAAGGGLGVFGAWFAFRTYISGFSSAMEDTRRLIQLLLWLIWNWKPVASAALLFLLGKLILRVCRMRIVQLGARRLRAAASALCSPTPGEAAHTKERAKMEVGNPQSICKPSKLERHDSSQASGPACKVKGLSASAEGGLLQEKFETADKPSGQSVASDHSERQSCQESLVEPSQNGAQHQQMKVLQVPSPSSSSGERRHSF